MDPSHYQSPMSAQVLPVESGAVYSTRTSDAEEVTVTKPPLTFVSVGRTQDGQELYSLHPSTNPSSSTLSGEIVGQVQSKFDATPQKSVVTHHQELSAVKETAPQLPEKDGSRTYRWLRWGFGSVYRRIFTLAYGANLAVLLALVIKTSIQVGTPLTSTACATAVTANILASLLARNEHVVNALFLVFGTWPARRAPLSMRRLFAKVYSYGGVHSGCGVAATFWFIAYLVLATRDYAGRHTSLLRGYILLVSYLIVVFLVAILAFAHPRMRVRMHNWFECTHRYLGWSIVLLFWLQVLMSAADEAQSRGPTASLGAVIAATPAFWMLLAVTMLVVYPWSHLRRREVEAEVLSDHVVKLSFNYADVHYGQAVRLTDAPLRETHAFAVIPNVEKPSADISSMAARSSKKGFSVLVSNAGDWTRRVIANPPKQIWTRGLPQYGVLRVAGLFEPVIVIATGSGIGPCLSLFVERPEHPVRIIWSAAKPVETYGQAVVGIIRRADPQAIIHDTRKDGRPDLVAMAHAVWAGSREEAGGVVGGRGGGSREVDVEKGLGSGNKGGRCEAVVIISNQKVTKKVVYGLESRGVPAYGAIFDS